MSDPFREIMEAERFEKKLRKLAEMPAKKKRAHLAAIKRRESEYAENHEEANAEILQGRDFTREALSDENWNLDQEVPYRRPRL